MSKPLRFAPAAIVWLFFARFCVPLVAQVTGVKDTQAVQVMANSIQAMGGTQARDAILDTVVVGTLTHFQGGQALRSAPITIKTRGANFIRTEIAGSDGVELHIRRGDQAWLIRNGRVRPVPYHSSNYRFVEHLPLFSRLVRLDAAVETIKYLGTGLAGSARVHMVDWVRTASDARAASLGLDELTRVEYLIDTTSFLPLAMRSFVPSVNDVRVRYPVEVSYSDYRRVGAILLPFLVTRYFRGQKLSALQLNSILFNRGVPDTEFRP